MFKKVLCLSVLSLVFIIVSGLLLPAAAGTKVGYINLNRLVKESTQGKTASANIEKMKLEKQAVISKKLEEINATKIDLQAKNELLKEDEKKDRLDSLNSLIKEYKRMITDAKEDIEKEDRALVAQILKQADSALKKVAKKKKFTMILKDPNAIGYLDPSVDITDDVLKELNKL